MDMPRCPFCGDFIARSDESSVLGAKGCVGINEASKTRDSQITMCPGQLVHKECRRLYIDPCQIKKHIAENVASTPPILIAKPYLRSRQLFKHCFFCCQPAKVSDRKRGFDVFPVRTNDFQTQIILCCNERDDEWASQIRGRLETISDLHAADAVYHHTCNTNFRTHKQIPSAFSTIEQESRTPKGRPKAPNDNFLKVIGFLEENKEQQVTVLDLAAKMTEICAFSSRHLKRRLEQHYGNKVIFSGQRGKSCVITFRKAASSILQTFHQRQKHLDEESEKREIIETAAKLIRNDVMSMEGKQNVYPSPTDIESDDVNTEYLPASLLSLLQNITQVKDTGLKVAAIGQAIIQATRPRALLAPLQLELGVQLHQQTGSKFLIDTINALGFCISYTEVQRFECSAALQQGTNIVGFQRGNFVQYTADNVDHNSCTLDGKGTFHGMGIIACTTPGVRTRIVIDRLNVQQDDIKSKGDIDIKFYQPPSNKFTTMKYGDLKDLRTVDNIARLDRSSSLLWLPGWSGIMQMCQKGPYPGKSSVTFLPMIDLSASDPSCIYSTMLFVCEHARRYDVSPVLTFDQPLFWKATMIAANEPQGSPLQSIILHGVRHGKGDFQGSIPKVGDVSSRTALKDWPVDKEMVTPWREVGVDSTDSCPTNNMDDFYVYMAGTLGEGRPVYKGSLMLQALVKVFCTYMYTDSLCDMMIKVEQLLEESRLKTNQFQMPRLTTNTLKKDLYFHVKSL